MKKKTQHLLSTFAFVTFLFMAYGSGDDKKKENNNEPESPIAVETSTNEKEEEKKQSNWDYSEDEDKMEGNKQFFASTTSTNTVEFEFPYDGGSNMNIVIRNLGKENDAILTISKGQFLTSISDGQSFKVKFDNEKTSTFYFASASDGSSDIVFINNSAGFISKIKKAKKIMLEIPFFDAGNKIFEFNVEGLKWDK